VNPSEQNCSGSGWRKISGGCQYCVDIDDQQNPIEPQSAEPEEIDFPACCYEAKVIDRRRWFGRVRLL
jgi:hypothetical protein